MTSYIFSFRLAAAIGATLVAVILMAPPGLQSQEKTGGKEIDFRSINNLKCDTYSGELEQQCKKELRRRESKRVLYLRGARFTNSSVSEVKKYPNLSSLVLAYSRVSNNGLSHLYGHESLVYLNLNSTPISNGGMSRLNRIPRLAMLDVAHTGINEQGLYDFKRDWLSRLNISHTKMSADGIKKLPEHYPGLKRLDMMQLPVKDEILLALIGSSSQELKKYKEEHGDFFGGVSGLFGPEDDRIGIENRGLKELRDLNLAGTDITNEGIVILSAVETLRLLNVSYTLIDDQGMDQMPRNQDLEVLSLSGTRITDDGIDALMELDDLKVLSLENTAITDEALETLAEHDSLRSIYLKESKVTLAGLKKLNEQNEDIRIHHPEWAAEEKSEEDDLD